LQDKLVGDQPLTPERGEEIAKTMNRNGCSAGAAVDATRMRHAAE
jgi:hypothetical protein